MAPEDLITDPVGWNLAWGGGTGCRVGDEKGNSTMWRRFHVTRSHQVPWAEGPSCHLHPEPPPATGRPKPAVLPGGGSEGRARTAGDAGSRCHWFLAHAHPKSCCSIPSGAPWGPRPFCPWSTRSREGAAAHVAGAPRRTRVPASWSAGAASSPQTIGPRRRALKRRVAPSYLPWT